MRGMVPSMPNRQIRWDERPNDLTPYQRSSRLPLVANEDDDDGPCKSSKYIRRKTAL